VQGVARKDGVLHGQARFGRHGTVWPGQARYGKAWLGEAWQGRQGVVRFGEA